MGDLTLPAIVDRAAVAVAAAALFTKLSPGATMVIDASQVGRIGQHGLQLLVSARRTAIARDAALHIASPSDALQEAVALCGLGPILGIECAA
jgi:anti-anti-sigma regulatory factor